MSTEATSAAFASAERAQIALRLLGEHDTALELLRKLNGPRLQTAVYLAKGFTLDEIGRLMDSGKGSAQMRVSRSIQKLGLSTRAELICLVAKAGLS